MKKLEKTALETLKNIFDPSQEDCFEAGYRTARTEIYNLIKSTDEQNSSIIKDNPKLATFLLLELAEKVKTYGEEDV